jgi:hypothetical protein
VVSHKVILDSEKIGVHNGHVFQLHVQIVAEASKRCIERDCSSVVCLEATILINIAVIFTRNRKLLRQATKSPCSVYPEVPTPVGIQHLQISQELQSCGGLSWLQVKGYSNVYIHKRTKKKIYLNSILNLGEYWREFGDYLVVRQVG